MKSLAMIASLINQIKAFNKSDQQNYEEAARESLDIILEPFKLFFYKYEELGIEFNNINIKDCVYPDKCIYLTMENIINNDTTTYFTIGLEPTFSGEPFITITGEITLADGDEDFLKEHVIKPALRKMEACV